MKTDVQTLIAALMTERNSLDRAIAALRMISPDKPAQMPRAATTRRPSHRVRLSPETKAVIVARMEQAAQSGESLYSASKAAMREYGGSRASIYSNWRKWRASGATPPNGNGMEPNAAMPWMNETTAPAE